MRRVATVAIALALAGCGSASPPPRAATPSPGRARRGAWTGLGSTLAAWETAHPRGDGPAGSGCSGEEGCYGAQVKDDAGLSYQFTEVLTSGAPANRVVAYEQAIGDDTSLGDAKAAVLALMPAETKTTAFWVSRDENGSCAMWNLQSSELGELLGSKQIGDSRGDVGVTLSRLTSSNTLDFDARDVPDASVGIAPAPRSASC